MTRAALLFALFIAIQSFSSAAQAEVRLGRNVRIGGHQMAPQTFSQKRRGVFHLYRDTPRNEGCRWVASRGGRTKVCHWRVRPH